LGYIFVISKRIKVRKKNPNIQLKKEFLLLKIYI